jgi:hypothetical protein
MKPWEVVKIPRRVARLQVGGAAAVVVEGGKKGRRGSAAV